MQKFSFQALHLKDAYRIEPFFAPDERGGLIKDYHIDTFKANGIEHELKEVFYTVSHRGVIRAIHFPLYRQQPKVIRCISGHIYDVIVDLRPNSETFGQWLGFDLSGDNRTSILVPASFGHGYLVLEDAIVSYKCSEVFYEKGDAGILWNDPDIGIQWPLAVIGGEKNLLMSEKDKTLMSFQEYTQWMKTGRW